MVMGVVVSHSDATEKVLSSVSAAVGSYDETLTKPPSCWRSTESTTTTTPDNIFVFCDGVSETQFEQVKEKEIPLIQAAIKKVSKSCNLSVFVIQKIHHTRFMLTQSRRSHSYNVPSGTVVDRSIVEPFYDAFYLNSHFSLQGTSKPTKYICLLDELQMATDEL
ncbi:PREDICTED: protein argonaute 2-like [Rhagoletis zephyria]|uniref:protein argonaute 2-like n=1 Tax=Rhagoletis zephyria TaxID=28612 RepID=UPI0008119549|nr:PREDICTED: protein argonaute 2-like [Rhagoletis zephyria]